jgi:hypothetical protein
MSQTSLDAPPRAATHSPALWRVAGALAIAHVVQPPTSPANSG